ncbi:MAG TPA: N-acetyltransferase [Geminicoccus sp.]|nr:N-acetyltransferase [Geminicoccus sp.]HWL69071.1 N-acetyltransferase [Geminicoccus sp.]
MDGPAIELLLDRSFGSDRRRKISYRYRFGVPPVRSLCLVALDDRAGMVGAIRYWPLLVGARACLLLGPLAIDPARRGQGIGRLLMARSLDRAAQEGWQHVYLVGDPGYYRQFGFELVAPGLVMPGENPARLMGRSLGSVKLPEAGVLLPWPAGRQLVPGQPVQPGEQRRAHDVEALVAGHPLRPLADPLGQSPGVAGPGDCGAEGHDRGVDGEQDVAGTLQPAQGLAFDPKMKLAFDRLLRIERTARPMGR